MAVSGRTSKVSPIIATLCILIYVAAVGFGAIRIIVDMGERRNLANREFQELAERASSSAVFFGFMSPEYQESIRDFVSTSQTLLGAIISSSSGDFSFERDPGSGITWAGNTPQFRSRFGLPAQPLFLPLRIEGQAHTNIQAIYSQFNNTFLLVVLRDTLFAVLIALAIAFITLIIEITQRGRTYYQGTAPTDTAIAGTAPVDKAAGSKIYSEPGIDDWPTNEDTPQGLFTPRGNIGWESYTHARLASELHRCASFEQDLVLIVLEFKCAEKLSDPVYRQFSEEAVTFFTMRDLIFEKGEKGITVIIPSADLEQGMVKAEEFRNRIIAKLPESFTGRAKLFSGLSSRSGRLIEAERLTMEANTALDKTQEEPVSHIVAFKSDPEKYRKFIRRKV